MNLIEEMKPTLTLPTATLYTPTIATAVTQPTPHYAWSSDSPTSITAPFQETRLANSHSPASSERSMHSNRSDFISLHQRVRRGTLSTGSSLVRKASLTSWRAPTGRKTIASYGYIRTSLSTHIGCSHIDPQPLTTLKSQERHPRHPPMPTDQSFRCGRSSQLERHRFRDRGRIEEYGRYCPTVVR